MQYLLREKRSVILAKRCEESVNDDLIDVLLKLQQTGELEFNVPKTKHQNLFQRSALVLRRSPWGALWCMWKQLSPAGVEPLQECSGRQAVDRPVAV